MKRYLILFSAAILALAGCSKAKQLGTADSVCTFEVNADQVATKAVIDGDGAGVNVSRFIMEVYLDKAGELTLFDRQVAAPTSMSPAKTKFTLTLVKDQEYKVLFWADKCGADLDEDLYYDTADLREVKFKGTYVGNIDARDAFSKMEVITAQMSREGFQKSVKLTRPFSQVNFIATDIDKIMKTTSADEFLPTNVKVEFAGFTQFNVLDQTASVPAALVSEAAVYSATTPSTSVTEYTLSMDYLLTMNASEAETRDLVLTAYAGTYELTKIEVANAPIQRNYRTNIKGNLLTSVNEFVVEVDPVWNTPDLPKNHIVPGIADLENNNWEIESEEGLMNLGAAFSALTVTYPNTLTINVTLAKDLDFSNFDWTVSDLKGQSYVSLVLDGNGKTISNLVLTGEYDHLAMFDNIGCVGDQYGGHMTIQNLTVKDCSFTSTKAGSYVGLFGANASSVYFNNVTVDGCTVSAKKYAGALIAYDAHGSSKPQIIGCTVKNCQVSAIADSGSTSSGAFYGYTQCPHYLKDCASTDNTVTGVYAGAYYGNLNATGTFNNCTVNGVVATEQSQVDGRPDLGTAVFE